MNDKHFCILPWVHFQMSPNGKIHSCCQTTFRKSLGDANKQSLQEIWQGLEFNNLREKMLRGEASEECQNCYTREKLGHESLRTLSNKEFSEINTDSIQKPLSLDLRFDNKCNFKCRSCGPNHSTGWKEDFERLRPEAGAQPKFIEISEKTYQQIKNLLPHLNKIYFAGGEPLISKYHPQILEDLVAAECFETRLLYNTNLSVLTSETINHWNKFKSVAVSASLDGTGEVGEFIRKGFRWKNFINNRQKLREQCPHIHFKIDWTLSIYNIFHLPKAIEDLFQFKIIENLNQIYINYLFDPAYLSPKILSALEKEKLKSVYEKALLRIQNQIDEESFWCLVAMFSKILKFIKDPVDPALRSDFSTFNKQLDLIRNESSFELFPDLRDLLPIAPTYNRNNEL